MIFILQATFLYEMSIKMYVFNKLALNCETTFYVQNKVLLLLQYCISMMKQIVRFQTRSESSGIDSNYIFKVAVSQMY